MTRLLSTFVQSVNPPFHERRRGIAGHLESGGSDSLGTLDEVTFVAGAGHRKLELLPGFRDNLVHFLGHSLVSMLLFLLFSEQCSIMSGNLCAN